MTIPPRRYVAAALLGLIPGALLCYALGNPGMYWMAALAGAVGVVVALALTPLS